MTSIIVSAQAEVYGYSWSKLRYVACNQMHTYLVDSLLLQHIGLQPADVTNVTKFLIFCWNIWGIFVRKYAFFWKFKSVFENDVKSVIIG